MTLGDNARSVNRKGLYQGEKVVIKYFRVLRRQPVVIKPQAKVSFAVEDTLRSKQTQQSQKFKSK